MTDYSYFSADYFENGEKCGTAYSNYKQGARQSPTYRGIAETLIEAFAPKSVLEIGCATGIIVKHMNDMGVDAHGIDVSEWAIENREHDNVVLAGAERLPYEDNQFDLVFSVHALEHIPEHLADAAFAEISRVSNGVQVHMLPIVGTPPYTGSTEDVIRDLKKDPTHNLLHNKDWWVDRLAVNGSAFHNLRLLWPSDTDNCELATCQLIFGQSDVITAEEITRRVDQQNIKTGIGFQKNIREIEQFAAHDPTGWLRAIGRPILNRLVGRVQVDSDRMQTTRVQNQGEKKFVSGDHFSALSPTLEIRGGWRDLVLSNSKHLDFSNGKFSLLASTNSQNPEVPARLALVGKNGAVVDRWLTFSQGLSFIEFEADDFDAVSDEIDFSKIEKLYFGGQADAEFRIILSIANESGRVVTVAPWELQQ